MLPERSIAVDILDFSCFRINNFQGLLPGRLVITTLHLFHLCHCFNGVPSPSPLFLWCQMSHLFMANSNSFYFHLDHTMHCNHINITFFGNKILLFVFTSSSSTSKPGCWSTQTMSIFTGGRIESLLTTSILQNNFFMCSKYVRSWINCCSLCFSPQPNLFANIMSLPDV